MLNRVNPFSGVSAGSVAITSGSAVFSNSNGLTFGASGNTITGSYSVPSTAGLISAINVSAGATSNNLSAITFSNSNGLAFGLNGSTLTGSYTVPTVTNSSWSVSDAATSGTVARLAFTNLNGVTLSLSTGAGGSHTIVGSHNALTSQSTQFQAMTLAGNTAGTTTFNASNNATLFFNGGNNITLSGNGSTVAISAANQTNQTLSLAATSNTAGNTSGMSVDARSLTLVGYGIASVGYSTSAGGSSIVVSASQTVQTQNLHDVSLSGNTAGVLALISSGTAIFAGGNNITLSQNGQSVTISGANVGGAQTGISSVFAGGGTQTVGMVSFANSNGVTFGMSTGANTGTITASVAAQSNQTLSLAGTSNTAGNTSGMSVDARSITLAGYGIASVGFSTSAGGSSVVISASQTVQTQNCVDVSLSGNTAGALALISSGTAIFAGGNNITLSQNGQSITISGANVGGAQTGISSIAASGGTQTVGMVSFANSNGITFGMSTGANTGTITASYTVPTQSNQTLSLAATSNTAGNTSGMSVDARSITIAGYGAASVGYSTSAGGSSIVVSVPAVVVQTNQTLSFAATSNTAGNTSGMSVDARSITLAGYGAASVGYSTSAGGSTALVSVPVQSVQPAVNAFGVSNTGQTAGDTGTSSGITWVLAGSQSITLSQSTVGGGPDTVWIQHPAWLTTADLSANSSNYFRNWKLTGNTAGTTSSQQGTDFWLAGGANITLSGNSNSITISGAAGGAFSAGVSTGGNTAGNTGVTGTRVVLAGGNNVTVSQGTDANGATVTISAFNQSNQTLSAIVSSNTTGNTSGMTFDARSVSFQGFGAASVGLSTTNTGSSILFSVPVQTNQTEGIYLTGNTTANSSSSTFDARSLSISGAGAVSVGWNSAASQLVISGGTAAVGSLSFYASSNTTSSTSGTGAGTISMVGAGAISIGATNSGWVVSSPVTSSLSASGYAQISSNAQTISVGATFTQNIYAVGNTSGTSSGTGDPQSLSISGGQGIVVAASNSGWIIAQPYVSQYEPVTWVGLGSAVTIFNANSDLSLFPLSPDNPLSFNQVNVVLSHGLASSTAGNSVTVSIGGVSSVVYRASYSFSNAYLADLFLFSQGAGVSTTNLMTAASTRNSLATFQTHIYQVSCSIASVSVISTVSVVASFPQMTSSTITTVNAATTVTTWGMGYNSWSSSITASTTSTIATGATGSTSLAGTWPATTAWSSYKLVPYNFATTMSAGEWWLGFRGSSSSSSTSSSASTNGQAGATFTVALNASNLTNITNSPTMAGFTNSLGSSLGYMGQGSTASLGPQQVMGSFTASYDPGSTYVNNAGQPNGAIAISNVLTMTSYFRPWIQFNNNRI